MISKSQQQYTFINCTQGPWISNTASSRVHH